MFKFNTESSNYKLAADVISTVIGVGASSLVGAFCNNIIDTTEASHRQKSMMCLGRDGFKLVTMNSISNEVRKNLDDLAHGWNAIVDIFSQASAAAAYNAADTVVVDEVED